MATLVVEYAVLTPGIINQGPYLIERMVGARDEIDASATEPAEVTAPDPGNKGQRPYYALCTAIGGNIVVTFGEQEKFVIENTSELLPVQPGTPITADEFMEPE